MSELLDDLSHIRDFQQRRGAPCAVTLLLKSLDDKTAAALALRIDDAAISAAAIAKVLERHGHKIPTWTLRRHRRRHIGEGCACP